MGKRTAHVYESLVMAGVLAAACAAAGPFSAQAGSSESPPSKPGILGAIADFFDWKNWTIVRGDKCRVNCHFDDKKRQCVDAHGSVCPSPDQ